MRIKAFAGVLALGAVWAVTGCGFFPPVTSSSSGSTVSASGDYVYVVNQSTDTVTGLAVGSSALTSLGTLALTAGLTPASIAVTRPNTFVYVGGNGAISCFSIGTTGALTAVSGGGAAATANFISLDTSPDGQWLLGLDSLTQTVYVYRIDTFTGALTLNAAVVYGAPGSGTVSQRTLKVSPNGAYVAVALGTGGDALFSFDTSKGSLGRATGILLASGYSDNAAIFDSTSTYLLVARGLTTPVGSSGLATYSIGNSGGLAPVQASIASGNAPYSLVLDSSGAYVYAANRADATISGYTLASGSLTALASSPFPSGSAVTALARDNSGKYIVAAASGGSSDVTLYSFDALTSGKLDAVAVAASGTDPAGSVALAATH